MRPGSLWNVLKTWSVLRALDEGCGREPPSPAGLLVRLGVLTLIAFCLGLIAKLLIGAA